MQDFLIVTFLIFVILLLLTAISSLLSGVPYVPTKKKVIEKLTKIVPLKNGEKVYDLGCGDGRLLFALEKKWKIQGIGYEIAPLVYILAMIKKFLNHSKTQILWKNFFASNLSGADIIFCYLMPNMLEKVGKKMIKECDKGTLIVSHTFQIKGLKPFKIWARHQDLPEIYLYKL